MSKIENEKQLGITERWIADFKDSLEKLKQEGDGGNPIKYELHTKATESMISDLEEQVKVYHKENIWIDARFGVHWIDHALKNYSHEEVAEIALRNGRARIKLHDAMKKIVSLLNPNNPKESEVRKIAEYAIQIDGRTSL